VFDLPVIVGIEEGLFEKAGLDVTSRDLRDRERTARKAGSVALEGADVRVRLADSYNVCEWASIDRLERGKRGGSIAALRAAVGRQADPDFPTKSSRPRATTSPTFPWWCRSSPARTNDAADAGERRGREHVRIQNGPAVQALVALRNRDCRAAAVMEPFHQPGLKKAAYHRRLCA